MTIKKSPAPVSLITLCLISAIFQSALYANQECTLNQPFKHAKVVKVIDGDTVELDNRSKLRFIGINTPELAKTRHNKITAEEPLAVQAKNALANLLRKHNNRIQIVKGKHASDKYGRQLAHVFVNQSINVQAYLLNQGWAFNLPVAPNLLYQPCYRRKQQHARDAKTGLWANNYYQPINASTINNQIQTGFRLITGKVSTVKISQRVIWINFEGHKLAARISGHDLKYFNREKLLQLQNKPINLIGYLVKRRRPHPRFGNFLVLLKHPDMILK